MKLVILAGGKGTRLGLSHIPKPMVEIGGKPLLQHQIEFARSYGIKEIFILSGHLANVIFDYFKDGTDFGVKITHIVEPYPLGTAGSVKLLEHIIKERFMVFYGDVMLNFDIKSFIGFDKRKKGMATLIVHPNNHPYDSDLIEFDELSRRVIKIHPKPHKEEFYYRNCVNTAVYILSPEIFKYIPYSKHYDFGKDLFPNLLSKGVEIYAYKSCEYFKDIGTKERLNEVFQDYQSGKVSEFNKKNKFKAIFLDRDGVINEEVNLLHKLDDLKLIRNSGKAINKINNSKYLAVVITNQPVVARNLCSIDELEDIHKKLETLLGKEKAYLDGIYYCPHHPDKGYPEENRKYKIECNCRKPKTGLIDMAVKELNISLKGSFLIGDSEKDIICGKNAGLTTIGVRTGHGCKNLQVQPDFMFEDLYEAVNFIVDEPYKEYFELAYEKYHKIKVKESPFIILISGNTRSGKSTLSKYLEMKFRGSGIKAKIISLDYWILPVEHRKKVMNVLERYQLNKIEKDMNLLLSGKVLKINPYDTYTRTLKSKKIKLSIKKSQVLIIEGVVAFNVQALLKSSSLKIFCHIDDDALKERLEKFYYWKGLSKYEIEELYKIRKVDEYDVIKENIKYADVVVRR